MKAAIITALAVMASSAAAAPAGSLPIGEVTKALNLGPSSASPSASSSTTPVASASSIPSSSVSGGRIVQDVSKPVNQILSVTGPNAKQLLIELSPEVAGLLSGLGLGALGGPVGSIVASAANVGDLVKDLGPKVEGLLTVVDKDLGALLIQLSPEVAGLVSGLGLPNVGVPVGSVVSTLGENLKRSNGKLVEDLAPQVQDVLEVTGPNAERLLVQLSPSVASLLTGLGLPSVGTPVGEIVKKAGSVGELVKDLGAPVNNLLTVVGQDGGALLIQLSPSVASLLTGLGLPGVGSSVGAVVATLGKNL
ncbi:uncharacterized protein ACHE_40884A [Aspergillus chevalieri]|uniref:Uncharacterized protein n=1 Tax=Aspergillus chevalieri TaxID=182096 RepID=A0A7R7VP98_ASPCH|nr:uncharacterized protein ACHE_40884A [Aspergillus chevalieri]BCR88320.1 hypothetical protein ACHE_40884A [Aspergillus chevalieri]